MKLRQKGYGTFAVTTDENFNRLPPNNATSLRLSNLSGKLVGIRNRHSVNVIEDFESGYDNSTVRDGTFAKFGGLEIQDSNSPQLMGLVVTQLPTITKESIFEISFSSLFTCKFFSSFNVCFASTPLVIAFTAIDKTKNIIND